MKKYANVIKIIQESNVIKVDFRKKNNPNGSLPEPSELDTFSAINHPSHPRHIEHFVNTRLVQGHNHTGISSGEMYAHYLNHIDEHDGVDHMDEKEFNHHLARHVGIAKISGRHRWIGVHFNDVR